VRVRNRGYCRVNNRRFPQRNFAFDRFTNGSVVGRDSPPLTAATISSKRYSLGAKKAMLASELRSVLTEMLVDKRTTGNRRCHVALVKQGIDENVELCTTLGREVEENYGQSKGIIEIKPGIPATVRSHVFRFPNPHSPPSRPAPNTVVASRNEPPWTAGTM